MVVKLVEIQMVFCSDISNPIAVVGVEYHKQT